MKERVYYVVEYQGHQAFVKPWSAVRDILTYSQQFLTPSIIEGIEKKLFPELLAENGVIKKIKRHKLTSEGMSLQQEQIQAKAMKPKSLLRETSILERGVLINPTLFFAFESEADALEASVQHVCLCRNEDLMFPLPNIIEMSESEFTALEGFELIFDNAQREDSFMVGYNRFANNEPMYGSLEINGRSLLSM